MKCTECEVEMKEEIRKHWGGNQLWLVCPVCGIEIYLEEEMICG